MPTEHAVLRVYETGPRTVVGFGRRELLDQIDLEECREEFTQLLDQYRCKTLAIDLTGVRFVPSAMLGLWASIHRTGVEVNLYNSSTEVREVLEVTRLSQILKLKDGQP